MVGRGEMSERLDVGEAEAHQIRKLKHARTGNVTDGIAPYIAVIARVGEFADADTIENNPDDSLET